MAGSLAGNKSSFCALQVSALKGVIAELRSGLSRINSEILTAAGIDGDSDLAAAHERFSEVMVNFQEGATLQFRKLEVRRVLQGKPKGVVIAMTYVSEVQADMASSS